jgi:hypothetical protein
MREVATVKRMWTLIGVMILLSACATVEEPPKPQKWGASPPTSSTPVSTVSKNDPSMKNIPVHDRTPQQSKPVVPVQKVPVQKMPEQVIAEVTKLKEPTLTDILKDKVLVSPYTLVSPISGKWAWVPDPTFIMTLTSEGNMQYGPTQGGFYQMVSPTQIRFQITQVNGVSIGGTAPQDWQVSFFESNTVLLLSKGAQAMPFKRLE